MKIVFTSIFLVFLFLLPAQGQTYFYLDNLTIAPAEPLAGEPISVTVSGLKSTPCVFEEVLQLYEAGVGLVNLDMCFNDTSICTQILVPWDTTLVLQNGLSSGEYQLLLGGCAHSGLGNTYDFEVGENTAPSAGFNYDTEIGCVPQEVTFNNLSINADEYLWDFGDGTTSTDMDPSHVYEEAGVYTITLTATNSGSGETDIETIADAIHIFDPPALNIGPDQVWDINDNNEISPDAAYESYLWSDGSTDAALYFEAGSLAPGVYEYWLTVTDENGCMATDTIEITAEIMDFTEEVDRLLELQVGPIPTQDQLILSWNAENLPIQYLEVVDVSGKSLQIQEIPAGINSWTFRLKPTGNGLYLLRIHTKEGTTLRKFIIQR